MEETKVTIQIGEYRLEVAPKFGRLARALLECELDIFDIFGSEDGQTFSVVSGSIDAITDLTSIVANMAEDELMEKVFDGDDSIQGHFVVTKLDEDEEEVGVNFLYFLEIPFAAEPDLSDLLEVTARQMPHPSDEPSFNSPNSNLKDIPACTWDGTFSPLVTGISDIASGTEVKVAFHSVEPVQAIERMWVMVTDIDGDEVTGFLNNRPVIMTNLKMGDTIKISRHHILEVRSPNDKRQFLN